jgi:hypothetical protein
MLLHYNDTLAEIRTMFRGEWLICKQ